MWLLTGLAKLIPEDPWLSAKQDELLAFWTVCVAIVAEHLLSIRGYLGLRI